MIIKSGAQLTFRFVMPGHEYAVYEDSEESVLLQAEHDNIIKFTDDVIIAINRNHPWTLHNNRRVQVRHTGSLQLRPSLLAQMSMTNAAISRMSGLHIHLKTSMTSSSLGSVVYTYWAAPSRQQTLPETDPKNHLSCLSRRLSATNAAMNWMSRENSVTSMTWSPQ